MEWFAGHSFKNRLTWVLALLALLLVVPTYVYVDRVYAHQLVDDRSQALQDLTNATARTLSENLRERHREISLLAQTSLFRNADFADPDLRSSIERLQASYPYYSWIGFADAQGVVRASAQNLLLGAEVTKRPWFNAGLVDNFVGDVHSALLLAKLLPQEPGAGPIRFIDFASPVRDRNGTVRGVLAAHAHWRWATDVVQAIAPGAGVRDGVEIFLVNKDNTILYPETLADKVKLPPYLTGSHGTAVDTWGGAEDYMTAYTAVPEPTPHTPLAWRVVVRQPTQLALARVHDLQRAFLVGALVLTVIFLALGRWVASAFARPLEDLSKMAKRLEQGDEDLNWKVRARSLEVRNLVEALRGTAATLIDNKHALIDANAMLEEKVEIRTAELAQANHELQILARRDALTGMGNRLATRERLREEYLRSQRTNLPCCVVMLDIDHFKNVNDTYGHAVGDDVLREVAVTVLASLRASDFAGRFGGEEFLLLLADTPLDKALVVAEKIRAAIQALQLSEVGHVTISLGVALLDVADMDEDMAVQRADARLYRAKAAGRNRVVGPDPEPEDSTLSVLEN
jgi:diguanylate cyclase (GGDEF)-like protein